MRYLFSLSMLFCGYLVLPLAMGQTATLKPVAETAPAELQKSNDLASVAPLGPPSSVVRVPDVKPGTYKPTVMIPLPPPGLPPLMLPPARDSDKAEALPANGKATKYSSKASDSKTEIFYSRDELQVQRARCEVSLKSPELVKVPSNGGSVTLRLAVSGGRGCVKGISSSENWFEVSSVSNSGEFTLMVEENDESEERKGEINIANTGTSLTIRVRQAPAGAVISKNK